MTRTYKWDFAEERFKRVGVGPRFDRYLATLCGLLSIISFACFYIGTDGQIGSMLLAAI